jgi:hypothetical protein
MALKKYDSFFYLFSSICFFISFICLYTFNIPIEVHNYYDFSLSENLNNVYMNGKVWKIELGLYMLFIGLGMIGIIWITDLDIKMEFLYNLMKKSIKNHIHK